MIHFAESERSAVSSKPRVPLIVMPPSAGGVSSRRIARPAGIVTSSPAAGLRPVGQLEGSDQRT